MAETGYHLLQSSYCSKKHSHHLASRNSDWYANTSGIRSDKITHVLRHKESVVTSAKSLHEIHHPLSFHSPSPSKPAN
eukprot:scaffold3613_cov117-Skeletonema_dohrnii-CCMP3373.AAC.5